MRTMFAFVGCRVQLVACVLLSCLAPGVRAQVDWSGNNVPVHGCILQQGLPVMFLYGIYDAGRTEAPERGDSLGAAVFWRDADAGGDFSRVDMQYIGQSGFEDHDDLFSVVVSHQQFRGATRVEYFTMAYDSTVVPVHADTTRGDANGHPPSYVVSFFGLPVMPHDVAVHFSVCLNGSTAGSVKVWVDPRTQPPFVRDLVKVSEEIPDLWEGDVPLYAGVAQTIDYQYLKDGAPETITHSLPMQVGSYLQGSGTDSWGGGGLGCHLQQTLRGSVRVHFSVCMVDTPPGGTVCVSGNTWELHHWVGGVRLASIQPDEPNLFEGDVEFPDGSPAVVQYKFRKDNCWTWESLFGNEHMTTNRFLYIGGATSPYMAPTGVWSNAGPNNCGPPTGVVSTSWSNFKALYR